MNADSSEFLYSLMPAVYRRRDAAQGYALRALFSALQPQFETIRADIGDLYDDWFAETCAEWVLPYIAEIVAARDLPRPTDGDPRRLTVNAIAYRRRKGTIAAAQAYASDRTGWTVRAIDYARSVAQTVNVGDTRLAGRSVDVRDLLALEAVGGWNDRLAHGYRVNRTYTLHDVGVFVWRLRSFPLEGVTPCSISSRAYTFDPDGIDVPLFAPVEDIDADVPEPLTRERLRDLLILARSARGGYALPFEIIARGLPRTSENIIVADLSDWSFPAEADRQAVAVDPASGRFMLGPDAPDVERVSYWYGAAGNVGGGSYARTELGDETWEDAFCVYVRRDAGGENADLVPSLDAAFAAARAEAARREGAQLPAFGALIVEIVDSASYEEPVDIAAGVVPVWNVAIRSRSGQRPALREGIALSVSAGAHMNLLIDGVRVGSSVSVSGDAALTIRDSTIIAAAARPALEVSGTQSSVRVRFERSVTGSIGAGEGRVELALRDSIVYRSTDAAVTGLARGELLVSCERSTILGAVRATELHAKDTMFAGRIALQRPRQSDIAYCALELAALGEIRARSCVFPSAAPDAWFASRRLGDAAFASLDAAAEPALFSGASDGMVIGAFHELGLPVRQQMLREAIEAMIPLGLGMRIRYET